MRRARTSSKGGELGAPVMRFRPPASPPDPLDSAGLAVDTALDLLEENRPDEALQILCQEALPVVEEFGRPGQRCAVLSYIAEAMFARGDRLEAIATMRGQVLPKAEELGEEPGLLRVRTSLAVMLVSQVQAEAPPDGNASEIREALTLLRQAVEAAERIGSPESPETARCLVAVALVYYAWHVSREKPELLPDEVDAFRRDLLSAQGEWSRLGSQVLLAIALMIRTHFDGSGETLDALREARGLLVTSRADMGRLGVPSSGPFDGLIASLGDTVEFISLTRSLPEDLDERIALIRNRLSGFTDEVPRMEAMVLLSHALAERATEGGTWTAQDEADLREAREQVAMAQAVADGIGVRDEQLVEWKRNLDEMLGDGEAEVKEEGLTEAEIQDLRATLARLADNDPSRVGVAIELAFALVERAAAAGEAWGEKELAEFQEAGSLLREARATARRLGLDMDAKLQFLERHYSRCLELAHAVQRRRQAAVDRARPARPDRASRPRQSARERRRRLF